MDVSNFTNVTTVQGFMYATNNAVDGILISGGIVMFFFIILIALLKNNQPLENALAVAAWSMTIIGAFFWAANLIPVGLPLGFLVIAAFDVLYLYASRQ